LAAALFQRRNERVSQSERAAAVDALRQLLGLFMGQPVSMSVSISMSISMKTREEPMPPFSHMSHTPFSHISEFNSTPGMR
jgi:hypothetical protein